MPYSLDPEARPCAEAVIKKSRFIARLRYAVDEEHAADLLAHARTVDRGAGHHCFAYLLGDETDCRAERSSDDGEPGGTAGAPILRALKARDLTNVAAVVSRYYGGVKLGTGGLARAYAGTVNAAIESASLRPRLRMEVFRLEADHADAGRVEGELRSRGFEVAELTYGDRAAITVLCTDPVELRSTVNGITSGIGEIEHRGHVWRQRPDPRRR
ncbi:IMPACT family protein [Mycolicibacterium baixiangningiae]|uniref:IMPACT family protein n=1 Tax=Mycolicibacterium baixiangningiae TaxID=2761578 RepID=UPI0018D1200C|nr:YigZ family protein [Mycolicibacterium baixiangningiae]